MACMYTINLQNILRLCIKKCIYTFIYIQYLVLMSFPKSKEKKKKTFITEPQYGLHFIKWFLINSLHSSFHNNKRSVHGNVHPFRRQKRSVQVTVILSQRFRTWNCPFIHSQRQKGSVRGKVHTEVACLSFWSSLPFVKTKLKNVPSGKKKVNYW